MAVADTINLAHFSAEFVVVELKFDQHGLRIDIFLVIIGQALLACDLADCSRSAPTNLARAFRDPVCHREQLVTVLIKIRSHVNTFHIVHRRRVSEPSISSCATSLSSRARQKEVIARPNLLEPYSFACSDAAIPTIVTLPRSDVMSLFAAWPRPAFVLA